MCIRVKKRQKAYQIHVYFFSQVHGQLFLLFFWWKKYKYEKHFSAFSLDHLQCFLCSILSRDWCSDNGKIPVTANEKSISGSSTYTYSYWPLATKLPNMCFSIQRWKFKPREGHSTGPRLILYDNRVQEHRHSSC